MYHFAFRHGTNYHFEDNDVCQYFLSTIKVIYYLNNRTGPYCDFRFHAALDKLKMKGSHPVREQLRRKGSSVNIMSQKRKNRIGLFKPQCAYTHNREAVECLKIILK